MDTTNPSAAAGASHIPVSNHSNKTQAKNTSEQSSAVDNSSKAKSASMCRFFRRGFCRSGDACRFRHVAPNAAEGADANTGRFENRVCRFYQQGRCRYGDSCRFRHIKPQAEAQEEEEEDEEYLSMLMAYLTIDLYRHMKMQSDEDEGGETEEDEDEDEGESEGKEDIDLLMRLLGYYEEMSEEEVEERSRNWGFTADEVDELLCHGVKPYDSDAEDVLAALHDDWYEHYFGYDSLDDEDFDWGLDDDDDKDLNLDKIDLDTSDSDSGTDSHSEFRKA